MKAGQAVISAIAVAIDDPKAVTYPRTAAPSSRFWQQLDLDTVAKLPKELLPEDRDVRPATVYAPTRPGVFTVKPGLGQEYALRFKYKNTSGQPVKTRLTITDAKR